MLIAKDLGSGVDQTILNRAGILVATILIGVRVN